MYLFTYSFIIIYLLLFISMYYCFHLFSIHMYLYMLAMLISFYVCLNCRGWVVTKVARTFVTRPHCCIKGVGALRGYFGPL